VSQHERAAHPETRNEKRERQARSASGKHSAEGYGKSWTHDEIQELLHLELQLQGHPQVAKQIEAHLPNKTANQIRDKREATYKRILQEKTNALQPIVEEEPAIPLTILASEGPPALNTAAERNGDNLTNIERSCDSEDNDSLPQPPGKVDIIKNDAAIIEDTNADFRTRILEDLLTADNVHFPFNVNIKDITILRLSSARNEGRCKFDTGHNRLGLLQLKLRILGSSTPSDKPKSRTRKPVNRPKAD
jgi:hypothetical protein